MDGVGVLVGDLDAELLLDGHDDLNGVETVQTEVVGEVGGRLDLEGGVRCGLYSLREIAHGGSETYVGSIVDLERKWS